MGVVALSLNVFLSDITYKLLQLTLHAVYSLNETIYGITMVLHYILLC